MRVTCLSYFTLVTHRHMHAHARPIRPCRQHEKFYTVCFDNIIWISTACLTCNKVFDYCFLLTHEFFQSHLEKNKTQILGTSMLTEEIVHISYNVMISVLKIIIGIFGFSFLTCQVLFSKFRLQ